MPNSQNRERSALIKLALFFFCSLLALTTCNAQTQVLTQHNDNSRSGLNPNETILNTTNVTVSQFGKLFALKVDGQVYAQPLYVPNVLFPGNVLHNVLIVPTENNSVYAFDADTPGAQPIWVASLLDAAHGATPGETPVQTASLPGGCNKISPEVGVTSTPVIDMTTSPTPTIFLVSKSANGTNYLNRLHALDLITGAEKPQGPVLITGSAVGAGVGNTNATVSFDSLEDFNRTGLLALNGIIYVGYATICDPTNLHGWIFAYNEANFSQKAAFTPTPNGYNGGLWMGNAGPAADSSGNLYWATGDGSFDTNPPFTDFGDSIIKMSTSAGSNNNGYLSVSDYFTPYDQALLLQDDTDLGSGGVLLLPDQPGNYPHLLVQSGKEGRVYLVNRDQMTSNPASPGQPEHYCSGCTSDPQIVQESPSTIGGIFGQPAYWNGNVYFWGMKNNLMSIPISNGLLNYSATTLGPIQASGFPEPVPVVSANGTTAGSAIVWAMDTSANAKPGPAVLYAFNASNVSSLLWTSSQASNGRDQAGNAVKFTSPTVVNGKVYVPTSTEVDVYGLLPSVALPNPALTISKGHASAFAQNQFNASYTIVVSNAQNGTSTSGTLTVTENLPSGLSLVSMNGTGWSCALNSCTRSDALSAGSSYPAISVLVDVADNAVSPQVNVVTLSGGGSSGASAADPTTIIPTAGEPAIVTAIAGTPQTTLLNSPFASLLQVQVTDAQGNLAPGVQVSFTAPSQSAGGAFAGGSNTAVATTNSSGIATSPVFTANNTAGPYTITATTSGSSSGATFSLTNTTSSASFVDFDWTSQGNWIGTYGQDGYSLANNGQALPGNAKPQILPSYVQAFSVQNSLEYVWSSPDVSYDNRGLLTDTTGDRTAQTWYNVPSFTMDLNITGGTPKQVAFYSIDFTLKSRIQTIEIQDAATGAILDQESVSNFTQGVYFVWMISGHVTITVICDGGENAVVSGIFFGATPPNNSVSVRSNPQRIALNGGQAQQFNATITDATSNGILWSYQPSIGTLSSTGLYTAPQVFAPQVVFITATSAANPASSATSIVTLTGGSTANFVGSDSATQGSWHGVYGRDGYVIAQDSQSPISVASFTLENESTAFWTLSTTDPRALQSGSNLTRVAGSWYSATSGSLDVDFADESSHQVALYFLDWDNHGRIESVQVVDGVSGTVLDTETVSNFSNGVYLIWNISGYVKIVMKDVAGPNATFSGIFFGGASPSAPTITSASSTNFIAGQAGTFSITTSGYPSPSFSESGSLPTGVQFIDNGNGTATLSGTAPANTNKTYNITITATNSVSSISQNFTLTVNPPPIVGASFVSADVATQGNWIGLYGGDGDELANGQTPVTGNLSYGTYSFGTVQSWVWASSTSDKRALETNAQGSRTAATWYSTSSFSINVNFTDSNTHQVALYFVDWDNQGRNESVQITDANNPGTILDSRTIPNSNTATTATNLSNGTYLIWNISGHVTITITAKAPPNAVLSGIFFGTAAGSAPSITSAAGTTFTVGQAGTFAVTASGSPNPALTESGALPSGVNFVDNGNGTATISGTPAANSNGTYSLTVTAANSISNASQSFTLTVNQGVVVTGPSASFVDADVTTQGNWIGVYGSDGHELANGQPPTAGTLAYGTYSLSSPSNWVWAASTTDQRALETNAQGSRTAATWYGTTSFSFDVNFTDGNSHQVALYVVDWDKQGRNENIQIVNASNPSSVLDSRTIPNSNTSTSSTNFSNGTYLVWNISGHVTITITAKALPNAVVSGIFFGTSAPTAPAFTSANSATFTANQLGSFTITTSGSPTAALSETGMLPSVINFVDNGNGTATLSGTPSASGTFNLTLTATNSVTSVQQNFTLTVNPAPTGPSASFVGVDVATEGNWIGVYGADGFELANGAPPVSGQLSYGTYSIGSPLNWVWAASTTDPRALETNAQGSRSAAAWYSTGSFSLDVNFTDGNTHQVALYVIDWDNKGRNENIQIVNTSAPSSVLDSRTIPNTNTGTTASNFFNGTYLIWNVSGHVTITITAKALPNAVVSGIFFH